MEPGKPTDRRVIRTKKAIRIAFARLLSEKEIGDITVSDVAALADINRKTFYHYYSGIHKIVDEIENDIVNTFGAVLGEISFRKELENPYEIFEKLTAIINTDMDFYGHIFSMSGNTSLLQKIVRLLKDRTKPAMIEQTGLDENAAEIVLTYMLGGMISVYQCWFNSDRTQSIEEISELLSLLFFSGLNGAVSAPADPH